MQSLNILSFLLVLFHVAFSSAQHQGKEPYMTNHEKRVYDALDNVHHDYQGFKKVFAKNALIVLTFNDGKGNSVMKSGTFDEVFGGYQAMTGYKVKWEPVTNTHANHPDRGVFATKYWNYGRSESGCEGLFSGIGTIRFNKDGLVTDFRGYSTEFLDFMNCIDEAYMREK
eukprot:213125_1